MTTSTLTPDQQEVTRILARFLVGSRYEDLPAEVVHEASRGLLNWYGCALGAARHATVQAALDAYQPFFGAAQAQIVGRPDRADILHAALLNGISSHVLDFDDTHYRAVHPSAPVLPAVLALCEWRKFSGRDLVHAYVLGVEAEIRIGLSVFPEHYDRGWHITGTAGVFGAAAAAGKLLGLDEERMAWALGIAATQSAGLREMFGSMCKSLHPGKAAQNGLGAALMAQHGYTSSTRALEAKRGFGRVMSDRFDPEVITGNLGGQYELMRNMYKPFACGLVQHAVIDGCLQLRKEYGLRPDQIEAVHATVGPLVMELTAKTEPRTGLEGKFSVYHALAAALVYGAAGEAQFSAQAVLDPAVVALRQRVTTTLDPHMRKLEGRVRIVLKDGRELDRHVPEALGTLARPMSDADLEEKFHGLAAEVMQRDQAQRLADACWKVAAMTDAGEVARLGATAR
ncbi:2-methylcitrate dehydratase [Bordetella genomosp. 9]|uniref:2-methylcitrate dehydratase n=1 Tax=Bordetella genomosp. 9 TaxID=1416803 RepID=A0A261R5C2_9BORD|nr:MmgE/PrpD family protein [Bordetella genomosp. 9]OZI19967.1 2-methylcitrate dehydratase [Bordetella genomosp. 9]